MSEELAENSQNNIIKPYAALAPLLNRLQGIVRCVLCDVIPVRKKIFQCLLGHILCERCLITILAQSRVTYIAAKCSRCSAEITRKTVHRNLAIEQTIMHFPTKCQYCNKDILYKFTKMHENECGLRPTLCKYSDLGCNWNGTMHFASDHEEICKYRLLSGKSLMGLLTKRSSQSRIKKYEKIINFLCCSQLTYVDLCLNDIHSENSLPVASFKSTRFQAFCEIWSIRMHIDESTDNRRMKYKLILKTRSSSTLNIEYFVVKSLHAEVEMDIVIHKHLFSARNPTSDFKPLPIDNHEENKFLSYRRNYIRIWMALK